MHAGGQSRDSELRALLRALRGDRRQREVAEAAGVSLSFYKRLEGRRTISTQLRNLIKVAQALDARADERASLIRLARPDLARMLPPENERTSTETSLRSLRIYATELVRTKGRRDAVRIAVELLYAALDPDWTAFALERHATGELSRSFSVGYHLDALAWDAGIPGYASSSGGPHVIERDDLRIVCAPIRVRGRVVAMLGLACSRLSDFDQKCTLFLDTVAAMLQVRLSGNASGAPIASSTRE